MTNKDFEEIYYPKYKGVIRAIARKLSGTDNDLLEDLEQEGAVALSNLDPSRASRNVDAWIRQAVKFRMIDSLRKMDPQRYVSLDEMLTHGDQLEQDAEAGGIRLISGMPKNPILYDDQEERE